MKRAMIALLAVAAGCGKKAETPKPPPEPAEPLSHLPAIPIEPNEEEILVTLGEKTLSRKELNAELELRLTSAGIPDDQRALASRRFISRIIEQFVVQSLLLKESQAAGIEVTAEDEEEAFAKIAERLAGQGKDLKETMAASPMGEDRMREEVLRGIRIDKLLAQRLPKSSVSDDDIDAFMEQNPRMLAVPESIRARHILIAIKPDDDQSVRDAQRAKADDLRQQLLDGADFEELARTHSEGPSKVKGGDLGRFPRGRMVPAFDAAAFSQQIDAIGPIVETQFGYHIIQVLEKFPAGTRSREEINEMLSRRNRQQEVIKLVQSLLAETEVSYADSILPLVSPNLRKQ